MKRITVVLVSTVLVALVLSLIPGGAIAGGVAAQEKSPATVELVPDDVTIGVGNTVDIQVHVNSVSRFYGVQLALRFNPAILDGVSVVEGPAFTSLPAGGYMVAQKDFAGDRARFAASVVGQPPLGGNLHVATIRFRGRDLGTSPLVWANLILANDVGASIPYSANTGSVEVADRINIVGYAFLQGRTNHAGIDVEASGPIVAGFTTAADGRYELTDVRSGRYQFLFEHDMYLATRLRNCDTGAGTEYRPPAVTLVAGDLNRDQLIDIRDLTRCAGVFGSADPGADINGDGVVNLFDLVLIGINFGRAGPVELTCP